MYQVSSLYTSAHTTFKNVREIIFIFSSHNCADNIPLTLRQSFLRWSCQQQIFSQSLNYGRDFHQHFIITQREKGEKLSSSAAYIYSPIECYGLMGNVHSLKVYSYLVKTFLQRYIRNVHALLTMQRKELYIS